MRAMILLALASTLGSAAEAPSRPEYVARLERICKPSSEATQRAVRGTQSDVRAERLPLASTKVARAKDIFSRTVIAISRVPRPVEDQATLVRWFVALKGEVAALGRTVTALRADDVARFQRVWAEFIHQGNKANNVVVTFGFDYCDFKPSRFR
jgi:hypothetical protein